MAGSRMNTGFFIFATEAEHWKEVSSLKCQSENLLFVEDAYGYLKIFQYKMEEY